MFAAAKEICGFPAALAIAFVMADIIVSVGTASRFDRKNSVRCRNRALCREAHGGSGPRWRLGLRRGRRSR